MGRGWIHDITGICGGRVCASGLIVLFLYSTSIACVGSPPPPLLSLSIETYQVCFCFYTDLAKGAVWRVCS